MDIEQIEDVVIEVRYIEGVRCPDCGKERVIGGERPISGDYWIGSRYQAVDLDHLVCTCCGFSWYD